MNKSKEIFIAMVSRKLGTSLPKEEVEKSMLKDYVLWDGIEEAMKEYALTFCQHKVAEVSHVEVVMADLDQWDKEDA